jgi:hypothetical protein
VHGEHQLQQRVQPVSVATRIGATVALLAGCQEGSARAPEPGLVAVGAKRYAPIALAEARPAVLAPIGARVLRAPAHAAGAEHVIAGYCLDAATLAGGLAAVRSQLAAEGWTVRTVLTPDPEATRHLVAAERADLKTSIEVARTAEPACDAPDQVAVGVTVYRVRS